MTGHVAERSYDIGTWATLSRRLSPYLDVALALVATVMSVLSLVGTDVATIDPRLEPADPVAVIATAVAGLSLVWRRTRPVAAFTGFTVGCLVVTLTDHYIGLLSIVLLFSLYSLAAHGGRRQGVIGLVASIVVFNVLALLDVPDLRHCGPAAGVRAAGGRVGRSATRSGRVVPSRPSACAWPSRRRLPRASRPPVQSSRSGSGSPASCTTWSRTACR